MLGKKYKLVRLEEPEDHNEEFLGGGELPGVLDDHEDTLPVLFSSLSASILREKREREGRPRRRHNAEVQTPGKGPCAGLETKLPTDDLMEPLLSLSLEDDVEMRTLLEKDETDRTGDKEKKEGEGKRARKRSSSGLYLVSQSSLISSKVLFVFI